MVRRYRIQRTYVIVGLARNNLLRPGVVRQERQGTDPVPIQAEILRARGCNNQLRHVRSEVPHGKRVVIETMRKPLVSHVNERQEFALGNDLRDRAPLVLGRIKPRRVVTAGMQQDNVALWRLPQYVEHRVDSNDVFFGVVIRIRL